MTDMSGFGDGQVLVNFATIAEASQNVQNTYNKLNQQLDDLHSFLAPLVAQWTGSAAETYQQKQREWQQAQTDLGNVLKTIGNVLESAHGAYQQTESANQKSWS
jgi:early secretory antigenic target protein ESAT-6